MRGIMLKSLRRVKKADNSNSVGDFRTYLFHYWYEGEKWAFEIKAASSEDALSRIRVLSTRAHLDGELMMTIPAVTGSNCFTTIICYIGNLLKRKE